MSKEDIRQEKSDLSQPPEYVEVEGNGSGSTGQPREESFTGEDKLSVLKTYDTVIIVDDSSSMQEQGGNGDGKSKWDEARDALSGLADTVTKYDDDGVDIYFLNSSRRRHLLLIRYLKSHNCRSKADVERIFTGGPNGSTPLAPFFKDITKKKLKELRTAKRRYGSFDSCKKTNYIVITDGVPDNEAEFEQVLVNIAHQLDEMAAPLAMMGIQFVQVGNDKNAQEYLKKLDNLKNEYSDMRDMIDTVKRESKGTTLTTEELTKITMGGFDRMVDNQS